ncbi:malonate--CoA ligase ACSF3, mitochondrial-like [Lytechinus variegatus]|uniref:malonate--CoA ligase ACSF3, mitochondrial-like n=1 Tax=Lytechinus variegatus TaxID=7654 RepID=UPI001BB16BCB|nr:malonate--CoA ligase ACSF3, mitochondrial-like [Lytechinus variegatus]
MRMYIGILLPWKHIISHVRPVLPKRYSSGGRSTRTPFIQAIKEGYGDRKALVDTHQTYTYRDIISWSMVLSRHILSNTKRDEVLSRRGSKVILNGERVAFLCPNDASYTITQWGVWMSGGMAVPLCKSHPESELEYIIQDSQSSLVVTTKEFSQKIIPIVERHMINYMVIDNQAFHTPEQGDGVDMETRVGVQEDPILQREDAIEDNLSIMTFNHHTEDLIPMNSLTEKWKQIRWKNRGAMLLYTSGTTGRPKGVLMTFGALQAQIQMMISAWDWTSGDVILHVLPLHHFHGVVNCLACPLWSGATCVMLPKFDAEKVWQLLLEDHTPRVNVFMAVPTVYVKLLDFYQLKYTTPKVQAFIRATLKEKMRLMVSGSAALPQPIMDEWEKVSGHRLLERYGMTELGMALTNPLIGERKPGAVGNPFPTVEVRIVSSTNQVIAWGNCFHSEVVPGFEGQPGDLQVKGPAVFKEYWNRPDATKESFTDDGWFMTGDTACLDDGVFRILGRSSVDIIKSGGYKISALDVERHLLSHPMIAEVAVVGLPDITWGQRVTAIVTLKAGQRLSLGELRNWGKDKLPSYQIPTELKIVEEIQRNAMGKVNKKQLVSQLFGIE